MRGVDFYQQKGIMKISMRSAMEYIIDNYTVLIDEEDLPLISVYKWHVMKKKAQEEGLYYFSAPAKDTATGKYGNIFLHRLVLGCARRDGQKVDHKNHNTLDCRKENLRVCTTSQNAQNARPYRKSTTGFKGIWQNKNTLHWVARIQEPNGKRVMLGTYETPEDAAKAYDRASIRYFGEFAVTNFPKEQYTEEDLCNLNQAAEIPSKRNSSGYVGVSWNSLNKNWKARYISNGKTKWLGTYETPYEAHVAREKYIAELKEAK